MNKRVIQLLVLFFSITSVSVITAIVTANIIVLDEKENAELIGQGAPTDVSNYLFEESSNQKRHYTLGVEMNGEGAESSDEEGHKVAIYGAAKTGQSGNPDVWAGNFLSQIDSDLPYVEGNGVNAQGLEVDLNNNQGDYYRSWDWAHGNAVGINITSGGTFPISSGLRIGSTNENNYPAYGMILDNGSKEAGVLFLGNHPVGIDFSQSDTQSAIVLAEGQNITWTDENGNEHLILTQSRDGFETLGVKYKVLKIAPEKPEQGLVVYADGDNWDPGEGEGLYVYKSNGWLLIR